MSDPVVLQVGTREEGKGEDAFLKCAQKKVGKRKRVSEGEGLCFFSLFLGLSKGEQ